MGEDALKGFVSLAAVCATLLGSGCTPDKQGTDYLTVEEFVPRIKELDGSTVTVAGYLGHCMGYDCPLFIEPSGRDQFYGYIDEITKVAQGKRDRSEPLTPVPIMIGIGSSSWECEQSNSKDCHLEFDRKAKPFWNSYVLITGQVTSECRDALNRPGCIDRTTDIWPTDIQAWSPPPKAKPEGAA